MHLRPGRLVVSLNIVSMLELIDKNFLNILCNNYIVEYLSICYAKPNTLSPAKRLIKYFVCIRMVYSSLFVFLKSLAEDFM